MWLVEVNHTVPSQNPWLGMLATCCPDSQMLALLANISQSWRHKTSPDTVFLCRGLPIFTHFFLLSLLSTMPHPRPHLCPLAGLALALTPSSALARFALAPCRHRQQGPLSPLSTTDIAIATATVGRPPKASSCHLSSPSPVIIPPMLLLMVDCCVICCPLPAVLSAVQICQPPQLCDCRRFCRWAAIPFLPSINRLCRSR